MAPWNIHCTHGVIALIKKKNDSYAKLTRLARVLRNIQGNTTSDKTKTGRLARNLCGYIVTFGCGTRSIETLGVAVNSPATGMEGASRRRVRNRGSRLAASRSRPFPRCWVFPLEPRLEPGLESLTPHL